MATYSKEFNPTRGSRAQTPRTPPPSEQHTRVIDLSVSQLEELIKRTFAEALEAAEQPQHGEEWAHGLAGLAKVLGCSISQAQKIKATGKYNKAIKQTGRKIIVNATLLRALLPEA